MSAKKGTDSNENAPRVVSADLLPMKRVLAVVVSWGLCAEKDSLCFLTRFGAHDLLLSTRDGLQQCTARRDVSSAFASFLRAPIAQLTLCERRASVRTVCVRLSPHFSSAGLPLFVSRKEKVAKMIFVFYLF